MMARPILAVGGIVLIGVGVALALGFWSESTAEAQGQVPQAVRTVRIDNDSGSVKLRVGDVQATSVHQRFSYRWSKPGDGFRLDGDQLVLGGCGSNCSVDYDIVVPRGTTVAGRVDSGDIELDGIASADVSADSGSVTVRNVAGGVKARTDSGDITLSAIGQDITAKAGAGKITGDGLRGKVDAQADSGSVKLRLDAAQDVRAKADSGAIDVTVPGDRYRVQGKSDSGKRDIRVTVDPSAPRTLRLDTDSGDVTVSAV